MIGKWKKIWQAPTGFPLELQELPAPAAGLTVPAGQSRNAMYRMQLNNHCDGAVALVFDDQDRVCFVRQLRPAVEAELWELPRGMGELADSSPIETAQREVAEEAGVVTEPIAYLGRFWVDSALLKNALHVVALRAIRIDGERDGEVAAVSWIPLADIPNQLATGSLTDGITLTAFGAWFLAGSPR